MRTFACYCGNTLFFRNAGCARCGRQVNFLPDQQRLSAVDLKRLLKLGSGVSRVLDLKDRLSGSKAQPSGPSDKVRT